MGDPPVIPAQRLRSRAIAPSRDLQRAMTHFLQIPDSLAVLGFRDDG